MKGSLLVLGGVGLLGLGFMVGRIESGGPGGGAGLEDEGPATARPGRVESGRPGTSLSFGAFKESFSRMSSLRRNEAMSRAIAGMDRATLRRLLEESKQTGGANWWGNDGEIQSLQARWAEIDPEGLLAFSLEQTGPLRHSGLSQALEAIAATDVDAAIARLESLPPNTRDGLRPALVLAIAKLDPSRAFEMSRSDPELEISYANGRLFSIWMEQDPEAALASVLALPPGRMRASGISSYASHLAAQDPEAALAWAEGLQATERTQAVEAAFQVVGYRDPEAAFAMLDRLPVGRYNYRMENMVRSLASADFAKAKDLVTAISNPMMRQEALKALANAGKKNHMEEIMELVAGLPAADAKAMFSANDWWGGTSAAVTERWIDAIPEGPLRDQARMAALQSLTHSDPEAAAKQLAALSPTALGQQSWQLNNIAENWAQHSPEKAMDWAKGLENYAQRESAMGTVLEQLARSDPKLALGTLNGITDPKLKASLSSKVAGQWARADMDGALQWSATLQGDERSAALRAIARAGGDVDPAKAVEVVAVMKRSFTAADWENSETRNMAGNLAFKMAETDPNQAALFAQGLPPGKSQDEAYAKVVSAWAGYAPEEAGNWLASMPAGDTRDRATGEFVRKVAGSDPENAFAWSLVISDPPERRKAAQTALGAWKANGMEDQALGALLRADVFTSEEVSELRKAVEP